LPEIFSKADVLLIAVDFERNGRALLEFSMPTKASEYMISGTPVLVYAPRETAVSQLFSKNRCGLCVEKQGIEAIIEGIRFLVNNEDYREEISRNAVIFAKTRFEAYWIREELRRLLDDVSRRSI
jgi:glycosyltransferase involved in cell wall biosynthesis